MPHQKNTCSCGKAIHWPKSAVVGSKYTCFRCGQRWTMVAGRGQQGKLVGSRPPKRSKRKSIQTTQIGNRRKQRKKTNPRIDKSDQNSSDCFVATEVYGDPSHPDVVMLRAFRDDHLKKSVVGRTFVKIYYFAGPFLALLVRKSAIARLAFSFLVTRIANGLKKRLFRYM